MPLGLRAFVTGLKRQHGDDVDSYFRSELAEKGYGTSFEKFGLWGGTVLRKRLSNLAIWLWLSAILAGFMLISEWFHSADDVDFQVANRSYEVTGRDWPEVWRAINHRIRTERPNEAPLPVGVIDRVVLKPKAGCLAKSSTLDVKLILIRPYLSPTSDLDKQGRACWNHYEHQLSAHEAGHVDMAVQDANKLITVLRSAENASCKDLKLIVNQEAQNMDARQYRYDALTDFGVKQWRAIQSNHASTDDQELLSTRCTALLR